MSATSTLHGHRPSPGIVALALGVAPLLAFADTLARGMILGLATLVVAGGTTALVATAGSHLPPVSRLPVILLVMAALLAAFEVACRVVAFDAWLAAGAFLPLVVANGALLACVPTGTGAPASEPARRLMAGLSAGGTLLALLVLAGATREIAGHGTLGAANQGLSGGNGSALAAAPAGGFFLLALIVAGASALHARRPASGGPAQ